MTKKIKVIKAVYTDHHSHWGLTTNKNNTESFIAYVFLMEDIYNEGISKACPVCIMKSGMVKNVFSICLDLS